MGSHEADDADFEDEEEPGKTLCERGEGIIATLENREDLMTDVMGPRFPPNKPILSLITGSKLNDLNDPGYPEDGSHNLLHQESLHVANAQIYYNSPFLREVIHNSVDQTLEASSQTPTKREGEEIAAES